MSRHQRSGNAAPRTYNRYPIAPDADGRGASTVTRAQPVGRDPLATGDGKADTAAQMEYLASKRRGS